MSEVIKSYGCYVLGKKDIHNHYYDMDQWVELACCSTLQYFLMEEGGGTKDEVVVALAFDVGGI